jgi:hypothetical protein
LPHRLANAVRHYRHTQGRDIDRELPAAAVEEALSKIEDEAATPGRAPRFSHKTNHSRCALPLSEWMNHCDQY